MFGSQLPNKLQYTEPIVPDNLILPTKAPYYMLPGKTLNLLL